MNTYVSLGFNEGLVVRTVRKLKAPSGHRTAECFLMKIKNKK
jgi:hypothetical protein